MTDELLIKFLLKETTEEERITVQQWLNASASNTKHFEQFKQLWNSSKQFSGNSNINEDEAWIRFRQKIAHRPILRALQPMRQWLKIAAILLLIASAWSVYTIFSPVTYTSIAAGVAVSRQFLPDGSELTLNKNTKLSYASNFKRNRNVLLQQGEVFFNVVHNEDRPFLIHINKMAVRVVGTSFNIKHLNQETEVIVETGIVRVSIGKNEITLHKGEKIVLKKPTDPLVKIQSTDQLYNYYRSQELILENTPLWRVAEVLSEAYQKEIVIEDPAIKNLTLNTTLKTTAALDSNLKIICKTFNITFARNEKQIVLSNFTK